MKRTHISAYMEERGHGAQTELAKAVKLTPGSIYQILRNRRNIFVIEHGDGRVELQEVKPIGAAKLPGAA